MGCNLYQHEMYLDKTIEMLKNVEIIEYDMRDAGFNIAKRFKLLSKKDLNYLATLDKHRRKIQMGLYQKENKEFAINLVNGFKQCRKDFFEANNIETEQIISIKKDAIFILNKKARVTKFDNVEFVEKNKYTSYYYINKIEFYYYSPNNLLHVKGISDELLELHEKYMLTELKNIFKLVERSTNQKEYIKYIKKFAKYYRERELVNDYYRELNTQSLYRLKRKYMGVDMGLDNIEDDYIDEIDISYNYSHYIIPLIQYLF